MTSTSTWTHDDVPVDVAGEIKAVKEFYGIPSLDHVPDHELVRMQDACVGDVVHIGKGRNGILIDIIHDRGRIALAIVTERGRIITRQFSA